MGQKSLLDRIRSPEDLRSLSAAELPRLCEEMRTRLIEVVDRTGGHLASNLGVVELTVALHRAFDFLRDRLVWDTSHQTYGHKLLTGRQQLFSKLREYQGCCGFASKDESEFDLFDAGHAGTGISAALGIAVAEAAQGKSSRTVAVVGDAAVAAGMSIEGLNHAGHLGQDFLVILNDNRMSIDFPVGGLSKYLNRLRTGGWYRGLKRDIQVHVPKIPIIGRPLEESLEHLHDVVRHALVPGQLFEELGIRYFGPIDGHDLPGLTAFLEKIKSMEGPILLHVLTNKGHGYEPAQDDPIKYHASKGFLASGNSQEPKKLAPASAQAEISQQAKTMYTQVFADALVKLAEQDERIHAITAAMPGGTGLSAFQKRFPDRYYDVGIAEQHGATFSSGLSYGGLKPVFAVYSTFLQRGFDQVVHDVCLQGNPVVFAMDRAGLVEDGPTHQGLFDVSYLRSIPGITLAAPADADDLQEMLALAVDQETAVGIRYPKAAVPDLAREGERKPVTWGRAEVLTEPSDVTILAYGSMVEIAARAAAELADLHGHTVGVVNMRFAKPLDSELLESLASPRRTIVTLEEHAVQGGFGSAVLEEIHARDLDFARVVLWGVPDRFIDFGSRDHLLAELELDVDGIVRRLRELMPVGKRVFGGSPSPVA